MGVVLDSESSVSGEAARVESRVGSPFADHGSVLLLIRPPPSPLSRLQPRSGDMGSQNKSLFVKGLNDDTTQHELRDLFGRYGTVNDIYIPMSYHTRRPRGFAYVAFDSLDEAKRAVRKLDGTLYQGREIRVEHAQGDRKTPHEMREKEESRNGHSHVHNSRGRTNSRRSWSRERTDHGRSRRSPHQRRSASPTRSRSALDSGQRDRRRERRPSRSRRSRSRSRSTDRAHRRSDQHSERHSHRRRSSDKERASRRSRSREA